MGLVFPLGLLGLLGLAALIIIYILKPNYQQKFISSTYVWKLSLKYKKKRLPVSKLRNIIIFICQVLIISMGAFILAKPYLLDFEEQYDEQIIIIDASANMLAVQANGKTRFENAITEIKNVGRETMERQGLVTVIVAGKQADQIATQADLAGIAAFNAALDELLTGGGNETNKLKCTLGEGDLDGAMVLAESILEINPDAKTIFYTAIDYIDKGDVEVRNIADNEWNAALLDLTARRHENAYIFDVKVASYGKEEIIKIHIEVWGVNEKGPDSLVEGDMFADCRDNEPIIVSFSELRLDGVRIWAYERVVVYILEDDSFQYDNELLLYGGKKETINIQYASTRPNVFLTGILLGLRKAFESRWDIELELLLPGEEPATNGFDFYIFEHAVPNPLPVDGVVFIINPSILPSNLGITLGAAQTQPGGADELRLSASEEFLSPFIKDIVPKNITVSRYTRITSYGSFAPLLYCGDDPVLLIKNEKDIKVAVMSFSLHYSNLPVLMDFPILLWNMIDNFLPPTLTKYIYDIDDPVILKARGPQLTVYDPLGERNYYDPPHTLIASQKGQHTVMQTPLNKIEVVDHFFVKIAASQSDFCRTKNILTNPVFEVEIPPTNWDILIVLASAMVALLFLEWWLQTKEQF